MVAAHKLYKAGSVVVDCGSLLTALPDRHKFLIQLVHNNTMTLRLKSRTMRAAAATVEKSARVLAPRQTKAVRLKAPTV